MDKLTYTIFVGFSMALAGLLADILLAAVFLTGFAFIHHGRAYLSG